MELALIISNGVLILLNLPFTILTYFALFNKFKSLKTLKGGKK